MGKLSMKHGIRWCKAMLVVALVMAQSPAAQANPGKPATPAHPANPNPYAALSKGKVLSGFRTDAVYLDALDQPIGARFIHRRSGFVLDLLQIQSVPQAFVYVNTFTVSDKGEPHTQEHLLIGKGNQGRNINVLESMSLTESNASTDQTVTTYEFNTVGGAESFYAVFNGYMSVLLHPDYTDEEVRREVCNWGVTENADQTLRLEEKGSVYNEMSSTMNKPESRLFSAALAMIYGAGHPLSFNAGGAPEAIRAMTPADIKRFHAANYHLGNMGALVTLPKEMQPGVALARFDAIFAKAEPNRAARTFMTPATLPPTSPAKPGSISMVEYPAENGAQPSAMLFAWPQPAGLTLLDKLLLDSFMSVLAGDANTNLYKKFIDSNTRELDTGAQGVFGYLGDGPGAPIWLTLAGVQASHLNVDQAALIRSKITAELVRIAAFKDGSPELREFNERFRNALLATRRNLAKFVNTPPGFGFRSGSNGYNWLWHTRFLNRDAEFRKSVTLKPQIDQVEQLLAGGRNFWRDYLPKWQLTVTQPMVAVAHPNPALAAQDQAERKARAEAETTRLKAKYQLADGQQAIRRYKADYDATTAGLEKLATQSQAKFIEHPPLTLDAQIDYTETSLGKLKLGVATFDNMSGASNGIAFRLDAVPDRELVYVSALPELLRSVGVIKDGKPIPYEAMAEMLRKDILSLEVEFSGAAETRRHEITLRASGNDAAESARALAWMTLLLQQPNWRVENLPRIRDVVDQQLSWLRRTMQDAEEAWVENPAEAWRNQNNPVYLSAFSFLTRVHHVQRLRWMLKSAGDAQNSSAIAAFLTRLGAAKGTRDELKALLAALTMVAAPGADQPQAVTAQLLPLVAQAGKLPATAQALAKDAAADLLQTLGDIPDASLAADWAYLCRQMREDLAQTPDKTLAELESVRRRIVNVGNARMFYVGSSATRQMLAPAQQALVQALDGGELARAEHGSAARINARLMARGEGAVGPAGPTSPVYVGLMAPNMIGGVMMNSATLTSVADSGQDSILNFLTSKLYSGGAAHSVFSKTISAGLAYSNGIRSSITTGLMSYYAERTPELPQTLRFAIGEVKRPLDIPLAEYVISLCFYSRASMPYEARGEAMAANMADGATPEQVTRFRQAILAARKLPDLSNELYRRKDQVFERILPGYGKPGEDIAGHNFFVIGAEQQMAAWEAYLKSVEGADAKLVRLYPRDFWLINPDSALAAPPES
jgi:Zn-dependent M16 (insulinase) family peptidase